MARTKTVYPTSEIAHLWAHALDGSDRPQYARNPQHNLSFSAHAAAGSSELRSYSTTIARIMAAPVTGARVALIVARRYSSTTAGHQSDARSAASHLPTFLVSDLHTDRYEGAHQAAAARNLECYDREIGETLGKATRARMNADAYLRQAEQLHAERNAYASHFGQDDAQRAPATLPSLEDVRAKAKKQAAEQKEERARRAAAAAAAQAAHLEKLAPALDAWAAGTVTPDQAYRVTSDRFASGALAERLGYLIGRDVMAVMDDQVITTRGARAPLAHVRRAAPRIVRMLDALAGAPLVLPVPIRLGHYTLDRVDADGTVRVGCHAFDPREVRRLAALLETLPAQADEQPAEMLGVFGPPVTV